MTQKQQQPSSASPSKTAGPDSFQLSKREARLQHLSQTTLQSLQSTSVPGLFKATPAEAFFEGTALHTAIRHQPEQTRAAVVAMVQKTVEFIDAKKTLNVEQVLLTAEAIIQNNPTTTLEELRLVCDGMKTGKYGKFYERLKTQEFIEALNANETARAELLEQRARQTKTAPREIDPNHITFKPRSLAEIRREKNAPIFGLAKHLSDLERKRDEQPKPPTDE